MTPPGWYPAPDDPNLMRYWDGSAWTADTAPLNVPTQAGEVMQPKQPQGTVFGTQRLPREDDEQDISCKQKPAAVANVVVDQLLSLSRPMQAVTSAGVLLVLILLISMCTGGSSLSSDQQACAVPARVDALYVEVRAQLERDQIDVAQLRTALEQADVWALQILGDLEQLTGLSPEVEGVPAAARLAADQLRVSSQDAGGVLSSFPVTGTDPTVIRSVMIPHLDFVGSLFDPASSLGLGSLTTFCTR